MTASGLLERKRPFAVAAAADLNGVEGILARSGAVFLEGYLSAEQVAALRQAGESIFAEREDLHARGALDERSAREHVRGSITYRELNQRFPIEANSLRLPLFIDVARNHLGREPAASHITALRRVAPDARATVLPFHQDQTVTRKRSVNLWVALTSCGVAAPSLEVVLTGATELLETISVASQFATDRVQIDPEVVKNHFGTDALWHPEFQPGDAMLFTGTTVHRTYITPSMTEPRLNAEMRLV